MEYYVSEAVHPSAPHHLPGFITAPGDTDTLMVVVGIVLIGAVLLVGNLTFELLDLVLVGESKIFQGRLMLSQCPCFLLQFASRGRQFRFELASNLILFLFGAGQFHLAPRFQLIQARSSVRRC